ncbi:MAG: PaaI family thioesterase [Salinisphaera sp.]|nr:PaaI family thioesterase [Salinisphaera sp.]
MDDYRDMEQALAQGDYAGLVAAIPYAGYLDLRIEAQEGGARRYRLPYREDLIGNVRLPALHGGAVAGFLENVTLLEVLLSQSQRRIPRVVDFAIDYLRSGRARDCLACCRVLREGSHVVQVQAQAWQEDQARPIAFARADFLLQDNASQ